MERVPLGVPGLDELLEGGIPAPSTIAIIGSRDSPKSALCQQIIYKGLELGDAAVYVTTEAKPEAIVKEMEERGWSVKKYRKEGALSFIDCFSKFAGSESSHPTAASRENVDGELLSALKEAVSAKGKYAGLRTAIDSLSGLINLLSQSPVRALKLAKELHVLSRVPRGRRSFGLETLHSSLHRVPLQVLIFNFSDVILELKRKRNETYLRVKKAHKTAVPHEWMKIEETPSGLALVPR